LLDSDSDTENIVKIKQNTINFQHEQIAAKSLLQIIFCTRTHTQITQFIQELRKTIFIQPSYSPKIKSVPICSRNAYCINEKVSKIKSPGKINEKCQEYMDKGKCKYIGTHLVELKNKIMEKPLDIEEIYKEGKSGLHCPYLATLQCMGEADILALPYQCILHKTTREALGVSLTSIFWIALQKIKL